MHALTLRQRNVLNLALVLTLTGLPAIGVVALALHPHFGELAMANAQAVPNQLIYLGLLVPYQLVYLRLMVLLSIALDENGRLVDDLDYQKLGFVH